MQKHILHQDVFNRSVAAVRMCVLEHKPYQTGQLLLCGCIFCIRTYSRDQLLLTRYIFRPLSGYLSLSALEFCIFDQVELSDGELLKIVSEMSVASA